MRPTTTSVRPTPPRHAAGTRRRRVVRLAAFIAALAASTAAAWAQAAPLARADVPDPLKTWVPWVLHGHEERLCPARHDAADPRVCVWPARLELRIAPGGASFRFELQVFGGESPVALPGEAGAWPQEVLLDARPAAITEVEGRPVARLAAGRHVITGTLPWSAVPQDIAVPPGIGIVAVTVDGRETIRTPGDDGRLWLRAAAAPPADAAEEESIHIARRIEDGVPMIVTTHVDLIVAGKPHEVSIPAALLPGFVALAQEATLPVRLRADGGLVAQARAGHWTIALASRSAGPVQALALPASAAGEEVWSFVGHDELRRVAIAAPAIDPKQAVMPDDWRDAPAYRLRPGETLQLEQTARGAAVPDPDQLAVDRQVWLDFDGEGTTFRDAITGRISRSSRLEMAAPATLGRVAVDGVDQPVTRRAANGPDGFEVRPGPLHVEADSRLAGDARRFAATGWRLDADRASATLHLPPGWRLLHARGVDAAQGSWVSQWSLWDFFFVLLAAIAAGRLFGVRAGALLGAALVLSWHLPGAPAVSWLVLLALSALARALPAGRLQRGAELARLACGLVLAAWLVPLAVTQVRLAIYPALEDHGATAPTDAPDGVDARQRLAERPALSALPTAFAPRAAQRGELTGSASAPTADDKAPSDARRLREIDPQATISTGPGVPTWRWQSHVLSWQGPVQATQSVHLLLLSPMLSAAWRIASVVLLAGALWRTLRAPWGGLRTNGRDGTPPPAAPHRSADDLSPAAAATTAAVLAAILAGALGAPSAARAAPPPLPPHARAPAGETGPSADASGGTSGGPSGASHDGGLEPSPALLQQLLQQLTAPPACAPHCVDVARAALVARGTQVQLRLEVHAQDDVALPLPGDGEGWHPSRVTVDGQPAALRRDDAGVLWTAVPRGVAQVALEGDVGEANAIEIALPLPVHAIESRLEGWTLGGLDARGVPSGALSLARTAPSAGAASSARAATDTLPPFVRIDRHLGLGLTWTATTTITRDGESRVPLRVHVPLVAGESVNDPAVQVDHGEALVTLGAQGSFSFASTIAIAPQLRLASAAQPNQVESWVVDVAPLWHAEFSGLAPIQADFGAGAERRWHPWPGESVGIALSRPAGISGQTFTVDALDTELRPGLRATDGRATLRVRASQGGNRRLTLPEGSELVAVHVDGSGVPTQASGGVVTLAIAPGAHLVQLAWREPRGIGLFFATRTLALEGDGVNAGTSIALSPERLVLAVGGPRLGPAVLFWGVVVVLGGLALVLGRLRITPLSAPAWFGLALGLAPASLAGAAVVVGWFFALAARRRWGEALPRRPFVVVQVALVAWTLVAASVLLDALHAGLLGYPDLMVVGNASSRDMLHWYADRFHATPPAAWVVSVPVLAWRIAMLLWALWMATAVLGWVRWAWSCYSAGGHWRAPEPRRDHGGPPAPPTPPTPPTPAPGPRHPAAPAADSTFEAPPYTLDGDEEELRPA